MIKNHEKTSYGKRIFQYKEKYQSKRCFLIGNGPSSRAADLSRLEEAGEITFAFNRIYNIFDETSWRPTFYISQDEKMLQGCADMVDQLDLPVKFIPVQLSWYHVVAIHDAVYFNMNWQQTDDPAEYLFSDDAAHAVHCASTGMYTAAQLASYMGFCCERHYFYAGV